MKVLRAISSVDLKNGGPINGLMATSPLLIEKGIEIEVLTLDHPEKDFVKNFPFPVYVFDDVKFGSLRYSQKAQIWLNENIKNYDAVIIHGIWQFHSYATALACRRNQVPYYVFTHGMLDPWFNQQGFLKWLKKNIYWKLFESKVISGAKAVLFTSETEKEVSAKSFKPYSANSRVVAYGSPKPQFDKETAIRAFYAEAPHLKSIKFMLYLSRIHPKKGVELLIEAASNIVTTHKDYHLVIAGPGEQTYLDELKALANSKGLEGHITWTGMLSGDVKWGAFIAADSFILPSHQENFGIVVSEALSMGKPVLITDKVNIYEQVLSAEAGLVCQDTADGVLTMFKNWLNTSIKDKAEFATNSIDLYNKSFSIESAADDLYSTLTVEKI